MPAAVSDEVITAIMKCTINCNKCPAVEHCTPDCVVNVAEQLLCDMKQIGSFARAIDATLRTYYSSSGNAPDLAFEQISNLIKEILARIPKED